MPIPSIIQPQVQQLIDDFSTCFDVRISFAYRPGDYLASGLGLSNTRYCTLVQQKKCRLRKCVTSEQEEFAAAVHARKLSRYECHGGLTEVIMPIFIEKYILGYATMGQIRARHDIPAAIRTEWCKHHPLEELESAFQSIPFMPQEKLQAMISLFQVLVEYIASHHLITLPKNTALGEVLDYLEAHVLEHVTLADVANAIQKSPSTLSHMFTREFGKSFKQMTIDMRLQAAEQYMLDHPACTVSEAATAAGYDNPFYFSRLYKRHRKMAPSIFLKQITSQE